MAVCEALKPDHAVISAELANNQGIGFVLKSVRKPDRKLLVWRFVYGLSIEEIARIVRKSESSVKKDIHLLKERTRLAFGVQKAKKQVKAA
jgi:DNA-directed RNA polymerase specialized sigma24 family protein